ncbi:MAG: putative capsular polysaccharide synthesis family protein [Nitriliruptorales bacterium]|nr:putative capsular polysaccharide synthesis family protein [Nitriliruptorales bacterium]
MGLRWQLARSRSSRARPVLLYQMGKVGSTSVHRSLEESADVIALHVHRLSATGIAAAERSGNDPSVSRGHIIRRHIVERGRRAPVISLVRDPIARNLSAYFHRLDVYWPRWRGWQQIPREAILESFLDTYPHQIPLTWFDRELREVIGIDVYAQPFDPDRGWVAIEHEMHPTIVLRTDLPDERKAAALSDFLDVPIRPTSRTNVGEDKGYGAVYREFMKDLVLPEDHVNHMLDSKVARHFFAPGELEALRQKWLGRGRAAA